VKIFVAGTFDPLHIGHQWLLWDAVKKATAMTVVIATDVTVRKIRGRDSFYTEEKRMNRLKQEMLPNTKIRLGRTDGDFIQTLREEDPDILLLGFDQIADEKLIRDNFSRLKIRRTEKYFPEFFKSSHFRYNKEK
jgi:cytidyltransferase-like protein